MNTNKFLQCIHGTKSIVQTYVAFKRKPCDCVYIPFIKWWNICPAFEGLVLWPGSCGAWHSQVNHVPQKAQSLCCEPGTCLSAPLTNHARAPEEFGLTNVQGLSEKVKIWFPKLLVGSVSVHVDGELVASLATQSYNCGNICFPKCSVLGTDYFERT